ncbi:putative ABC1 protein [Sesbania bispinosa]|nr:putative ABC1 protein [Sesbania bispinosa]
MEFMDGAYINDVKTIQKLGIHPHELSTLVSQTFAEMMFKHGFVHCDPHAANLLVRPLPSSKAGILEGLRKITNLIRMNAIPCCLLRLRFKVKMHVQEKTTVDSLDHGLYKELDFHTRTNYAALWKALIFADANAIKEYSVKLGCWGGFTCTFCWSSNNETME